MIARLKELDTTDTSKAAFTDVENGWYNGVINAVVKAGLMKGYEDGSFHPNAPITRAEFAALLARLDTPRTGEVNFTDIEGHWAKDAIVTEALNGNVLGYEDNTFRPDASITRAEAATMLNRFFDRNVKDRGLVAADNDEERARFSDLTPSFWAYYELVEATNTHSYARYVQGQVEEEWIHIVK